MECVRNNLEAYLLNEEEKKGLPGIISRISHKIRKYQNSEKISRLNKEIFIEENFCYKKTEKNFFKNMENREGDCLDFSLLYHFILQKTGTLNNMVSAKGHTMVKFPFSENLLETTRGILKNPKECIKERGISPSSVDKKIYLCELNDEDVFAIYLNKKSKILIEQGKYFGALGYINRALNFSKKIPEVFYNKGYLLNKKGRFQEAIDCFNSALDLDPLFYEAMNNIGISYIKIGERKEAKKHFKKVLSKAKNPEKEKAKTNLKILRDES